MLIDKKRPGDQTMKISLLPLCINVDTAGYRRLVSEVTNNSRPEPEPDLMANQDEPSDWDQTGPPIRCSSASFPHQRLFHWLQAARLSSATTWWPPGPVTVRHLQDAGQKVQNVQSDPCGHFDYQSISSSPDAMIRFFQNKRQPRGRRVQSVDEDDEEEEGGGAVSIGQNTCAKFGLRGGGAWLHCPLEAGEETPNNQSKRWWSGDDCC